MDETSTDFFKKAVTELGKLRPVTSTKAIFSTQGVKLLEKDAAVHPGLYEKLMMHQLSEPLEDSVVSTPMVTSLMLRDGAVNVMKTHRFFEILALEDDAKGLLLNAIERIPLPEPIAFQLALAYELQPGLYQHSLCSALIAAWLATDEEKISRIKMRIAAAGALLHDIGMLHLDPLLFEYKKQIDRSQRRQLYSHPIVSTTLIDRHPEYSKEVVRAVMEHHEFLDGSGYPRNLVDSEIGHTGRVLSLTELIVGAFAPGRAAPVWRLSMLLRMNMHRYDQLLSEKVIRILQPHIESTNPGVALLDKPINSLLSIDGILAAWPAGLADQPDLSAARRKSLSILTRQASQLQHTLARVGATPTQLAQLGNDALDTQLQTELTLLTHEAAWQLRTLIRQVRRRWSGEPDSTSFPMELQEWMAFADELVSQITGVPQVDGDNNP